MNIVVFGATGSIGALTVLKLLEDGHSVTAFSRHPDALNLEHPNLKRAASLVHGSDLSWLQQGLRSG